MHTFLDMDCQYTHKLALACGLIKIPRSRRTFDRRLQTISTDIKERISTMGYLFVAIEGLADASIIAIDSTLLKQKVMYGINHPWKKEQYLVQASIQVQDGVIVIPRDGHSDINYI